MSFGERLIADESTTVRNSSESLYLAAIQLDADLHSEALEEGSCPNTIRAAVSGAVACWAHTANNHLYVGNVGDSAAILIQQTPSGNFWYLFDKF